MSSNYRVAVWSDTEQAVLVRIEENKERMRRALMREDLGEEVFAALNRIARDDEERLIVAREWITYHR